MIVINSFYNVARRCRTFQDSDGNWFVEYDDERARREIVDERPQGDWYKLPPEVDRLTDRTTSLDEREQGPGIVNVRGIEPRPVATVGYDDPTGDDIAADWRRP